LIKLLLGNNQDLLKEIDGDSIDSCVTDPPYGLEFMNKGWDYGVPTVRFWEAVYRVLKPGAMLISFGGTRTYHRMACAIEDAGFEIRDQIQWIYGSGFPKSLNVGKAIACYPGYGTGIKPANEPMVLARKPLSEKTVEMNMLKWGVGALNIDGCRVKGSFKSGWSITGSRESQNYAMSGKNYYGAPKPDSQTGRFPSNLILTHSANCVLVGEKKVGVGEVKRSGFRTGGNNAHSVGLNGKKDAPDNYGTETVDSYDCDPSCPVAELDRQSGQISMVAPGQTMQKLTDFSFSAGVGHKKGQRFSKVNMIKGGASRFFYCAKASKSERNAGLNNAEQTTDDGRNKSIDNPYQRGKTLRQNHHATVKPVNLMRYLVRLVSPIGSTVLDPFMGSGTTGVACVKEGFSFVGMEQREDYLEIAKQRIEYGSN